MGSSCVSAALVSGLLWILSAQPITWWPLGWFAALPAAWAIDRAPTRRRAGLYGGAAAFVFTVGGFHWMVYLLRVNAHLPAPLAWLGLLLLAAPTAPNALQVDRTISGLMACSVG